MASQISKVHVKTNKAAWNIISADYFNEGQDESTDWLYSISRVDKSADRSYSHHDESAVSAENGRVDLSCPQKTADEPAEGSETPNWLTRTSRWLITEEVGRQMAQQPNWLSADCATLPRWLVHRRLFVSADRRGELSPRRRIRLRWDPESRGSSWGTPHTYAAWTEAVKNRSSDYETHYRLLPTTSSCDIYYFPPCINFFTPTPIFLSFSR